MSKKNVLKITNYSPMRYPGGKSKLYPLIALSIKKSGILSPVYIEPFAGGAGLALALLFNGVVNEIVINDYDKAIYSMWKAILTDTKRFISLIENTPVNVEEWKKQKTIYSSWNSHYSLELGFATFYLNRTNRSGILIAGPIGGYNQDGNYLIDARYNKTKLIERIKRIATYKSKIHLYNHDVRSFIQSYLPKYYPNAFLYMDPPYYKKGKQLYKNYFTHKDHVEIYEKVKTLQCSWMITYDNAKEILEIYHDIKAWNYDLVYGLANNGVNSELLFVSDSNLIPSAEEIISNGIRINIRTVSHN